jgi:hypothetical protein
MSHDSLPGGAALTTPPSVVVTTDKTDYNVGDPIQVTVEYPDLSTPGTALTVTATVHQPDGTTVTGEATAQVGAVAAEPLPAEVTDSFGDVYTQQSNVAGTAVFTSTISTPPAGA